MSKSQRVWFVTGSSRGLGREIVTAALERGDQVAATARNLDSLSDLQGVYGDRILPIELDVTDESAVLSALDEAKRAFGRIDVVVNNAGYGFTGALEEMTREEFKSQIDTNFWGVVHVTRGAIPILREQGSGHIVQVTSVGGRLAMAGLSGYQSAKFAVEGLSEAVAQEVAPLGIKLTIVEPGGFNTDWSGSSMGYAKPMPAYARTVGALSEHMKSFPGLGLGDPRRGAAAILALVDMPNPPLRLPLGSDAFFLLGRSYQGSIDEMARLEELTKSTDRRDMPPFDGPALLQMMGHA